MKIIPSACLILSIAAALLAGCGRDSPAGSGAGQPPPKHEHKPPHGGTPVVLGDEVYHVELVLDAASGKMQAYVFDGELENFIRSSVPTIEIDATVAGATQALVLHAIANPATGETVGDTSLFEGQADWLKNNREFDATLKSITVRGTTFSDVKFNFPKGNDKD